MSVFTDWAWTRSASQAASRCCAETPTLVRMLARNLQITDLALTTNGVLLAEQAQALYEAGLHRVTVSLDTLPDRFKALTHRDLMPESWRGSRRLSSGSGSRASSSIRWSCVGTTTTSWSI